MTGGNPPVSAPVPAPGGNPSAMPVTPAMSITPVTSRKYRKQGMS